MISKCCVMAHLAILECLNTYKQIYKRLAKDNMIVANDLMKNDSLFIIYMPVFRLCRRGIYISINN